jgi:hypothetical protein
MTDLTCKYKPYCRKYPQSFCSKPNKYNGIKRTCPYYERFVQAEVMGDQVPIKDTPLSLGWTEEKDHIILKHRITYERMAKRRGGDWRP